MLNLFDVYDQQIIKSRKKDIQKEMTIAAYVSGSTATYRTMYIPIMTTKVAAPCDINIDWGDGASSYISKGSTVSPGQKKLEHTYSSNGNYEITIYSEDGVIPQWYTNSWTSSQNIINYIRSYLTPLLKVNQDGYSVHIFNVSSTINLEYIPDNLFKNNSHFTFLKDIWLLQSDETRAMEGSTSARCTFTLNRNILEDLPNLESISLFDYLLHYKHNYNVEDIFKKQKNLKSVNINYGTPYVIREDKTFPNIFKYNPNLEDVSCNNTFNITKSPGFAESIKYIPTDLFKNNPKLYNISRFIQDVPQLETNFGDFDDFFHPEWTPSRGIRPLGFLSRSSSDSKNIGNALGFKEKIDLALERSGTTIPTAYEKGILFNRTGMEGYSSLPSTWRTTPF